ncbi:MAG: cell wall hydrolase, partial [Bartonella sp.]|nr:cell wall hydrolase [Bartonella sp.]
HCQFSFACDGRKHRVTEMAHWKVAQQVAKAVSAGQIWLADVGSATHYHAIYVHPNWAHTMIKVNKIGLHVFYRTRYGGWI